jgi:hypothetical protein
MVRDQKRPFALAVRDEPIDSRVFRGRGGGALGGGVPAGVSRPEG